MTVDGIVRVIQLFSQLTLSRCCVFLSFLYFFFVRNKLGFMHLRDTMDRISVPAWLSKVAGANGHITGTMGPVEIWIKLLLGRINTLVLKRYVFKIDKYLNFYGAGNPFKLKNDPTAPWTVCLDISSNNTNNIIYIFLILMIINVFISLERKIINFYYKIYVLILIWFTGKSSNLNSYLNQFSVFWNCQL